MMQAVRSFLVVLWWALLEMADFDRQPVQPKPAHFLVREVLFTPTLGFSIPVGFVAWRADRPEERGWARISDGQLDAFMRACQDLGHVFDRDFTRVLLDAALENCPVEHMDTFGFGPHHMGCWRFGVLRGTRNPDGMSCKDLAERMLAIFVKGST